MAAHSRQAFLVCAISALLILAGGCDSVASYTIENKTGSGLITRPSFEENCLLTDGNQADFLPEQTVRPFEQYAYEDIHAAQPDGISCVQVLTTDRRMVLAESYKEGRVYTVAEPLTPISDPVPEISELPRQSGLEQHLEQAKEHPLAKGVEIVGWGIVLGFWLLFVVGLPLGAVVALLILVRRLWRQRGRSSL